MQVIFEGEIHVHYRFIHLSAPGQQDLLSRSTAGQTNGLCGAAVPGQLSFVTGLHTGHVRFAIEWSESEPAIGAGWEDVVEASVVIPQRELHLAAFDD